RCFRFAFFRGSAAGHKAVIIRMGMRGESGLSHILDSLPSLAIAQVLQPVPWCFGYVSGWVKPWFSFDGLSYSFGSILFLPAKPNVSLLVLVLPKRLPRDVFCL